MKDILETALTWIQSDEYDKRCIGIRIPVPHNIVCTVTLRRPRHNLPKSQKPRVNLHKPARYMINSKRNESEFAALKTKYQDPSATTLTFPTYKMVCVGAKTPSAGEYSLHRSTRDLAKYCDWECFRKFSLNNIVCASNVNHWIDIGLLYAENQSRVNYDPTRFPGAKYNTPPLDNVPRSRCVMIFEGGAFTVMGIVSLRELIPIVRHIVDLAGHYRTEARKTMDNIVEVRENERKRHLEPENCRYKFRQFYFYNFSFCSARLYRNVQFNPRRSVKHSKTSESSEDFLEDEVDDIFI